MHAVWFQPMYSIQSTRSFQPNALPLSFKAKLNSLWYRCFFGTLSKRTLLESWKTLVHCNRFWWVFMVENTECERTSICSKKTARWNFEGLFWNDLTVTCHAYRSNLLQTLTPSSHFVKEFASREDSSNVIQPLFLKAVSSCQNPNRRLNGPWWLELTADQKLGGFLERFFGA